MCSMEIAGHAVIVTTARYVHRLLEPFFFVLATRIRNSHLSIELMASQDFSDRPIKKLVLFDVDGTLTPARQVYLFSVLPSRALIGHKVSVT